MDEFPTTKHAFCVNNSCSVATLPPVVMDVEAPFIELPLQVKEDGIYWIKTLSSGSSAVAVPNHGVAVAEEVCVWRRNHVYHPWSTNPLWQARAEGLLREGGTLVDEELLVKYIKESGGYEEGARHVAALSNIQRLRLISPADSPEMAYQQLVFPPVTALLYSFGPDRYAADSMVYSGLFVYRDRWGNPTRLTGFKPDAALKLSQQHLVLGMLELKRKGLDQQDMQKCVLLTSISALALARCAQLETITIPFVVNNSHLANLFTVTVEKGDECPRVRKIFQADMSKQGGAATIVAYLAVMLHRLQMDINVSPAALTLQQDLDNFPVSSKSNSTSNTHPSSSNRSQSMETSSGQRGNRYRGGREGAAEVASCDGEVEGVRESAFAGGIRYRKSPFYFLGTMRSGPTTSVPVFIKVWRASAAMLSCAGQGTVDRRRLRVETEIRLLKRARNGNVPCPEVVDRLTRVDVISSARGQSYHRLVMRKLPNHSVRYEDLVPFAVSLVGAVRKLHETGLLHCDIKPDNVLWDSFAKSASLVDFGHAQEEVGASSYVGTVGFTAPEVSRDAQPHCRPTDAYSVGKTLQRVCDTASSYGDGVVGHGGPHPVRDVASKLTREDPYARITLDSALRLLSGISPSTEKRDNRHSMAASPRSSLKLVSP